MDCVSRGNRLADQEAKRVATKLLLAPELPPSPNYTKEEEQWAKDEKGMKEEGVWWKLPDQRLFVPSAVAVALVKQQHELTHLEKTALENLLDRYYFIPKLPTLCAQVSARCIRVHETMRVKGLSQALEYKLQAPCLLRIWK
jgi:hypothetical protein